MSVRITYVRVPQMLIKESPEALGLILCFGNLKNINMMYLTIIVILIIELVYKPRLDYTRDGKLILWYNKRKNRNYMIIF